MRVWRERRLIVWAAALPLFACGVDAQDEGVEAPVSSEEVAPVSDSAEEELGQVEQGVYQLQAKCGHGTFATAYCSKRNMGAPAIGVYGCKARTTGRWIWWKQEMCGVCVDRGIRLDCGTDA